MISYYDSNLTDILPEHMKYTPECIALGYALQKANQRFVEAAGQTSVFAAIDALPENIIDVLAIELRTQYYDESFPLEQKRELVKGTMTWYNKAGTVSAVQELIDKVFDSGIVLEWFNTGGEPGTFIISTSDTITPELISKLTEVIKYVKNVRSHMTGIVVGNRVDFTLKSAVGMCSHKVVTIT